MALNISLDIFSQYRLTRKNVENLWIFHICFSLKIVKFGQILKGFIWVNLQWPKMSKKYSIQFLWSMKHRLYIWKVFIKFCWPDEKITDGSKFKGIGFDLKGRSRGRRTCRWRQKRLIDIEIGSVKLWLKKSKTTAPTP